MNQDILITLFLLASVVSIIVLFKTFKTNDPMTKVFFPIFVYITCVFPVLSIIFGMLLSTTK